ncbi:MAG: hypothetical protein LQ349_009650, partial [Xanthoria aureola]
TDTSNPTIHATPSPTTTPATSTNAPQQPIAGGLSSGGKAGIGVGVAAVVLSACGILYLIYRRRRRGQQTQPTEDEGAVDEPRAGAVGPQETELKEGGKSLDPPPAYPYEKMTPTLSAASTPGMTLDALGNSRSHDQSQLSNMESSESSNTGFYAPSVKRERSYQVQEDPDMISYHNRPEIDGNPLHEAPGTSKHLKELASGDIATSKPSSQSPINEKPSYVDLDHLSKLEQEERQLQGDIAQIERLERLKLERDRHPLHVAVMAWEHDAATAAAILATQLEDLEELIGSKDNDADGSSNDATVARQIYQEDLERHVATLRDHQIATLFAESPLENEDLPPILSPSMPELHVLNRTEGPQEEPETSSGYHNVEQQAERRSDSPILGLLARKRKASDSPPPTCKAPKVSDHT